MILFLKTDLKNIYFNNYHNEIKEPYILICHNSDDSIEEEDMEFIDSKIIYLFAQKLNVPLKKISILFRVVWRIKDLEQMEK